MVATDLRAWQERHGYTYASAADALGVSRATYARYLAAAGELPRMLALACAAVDAGLDVPQGDRRPS
jgi:transcriptional regulator with XRE-family HTH domain